MHIKISVIVPVFNAEKYLKECIDSIIAQTLREIEIICVDDGSTDNSLHILKDYALKDSRIAIIEQKNKGAGAARNLGLECAKGEYLSFLDADDFFEPSMLETMYNKAKKHSIDIIVCRSDKFLQEYGILEENPLSVNAKLLPNDDVFCTKDIEKNIFKTMIGWTWDKLFLASFIKEHGLKFQEQRTTNDMFFVFAALASSKKIAVCNTIFVHYRKVKKGSLSVSRENSWHCFYDALIALKAYLIEQKLFEQYKIDFINYALHFSLWNLNSLSGKERELLYNTLKLKWFNNLEINGIKKEQFYHRGEYNRYNKILIFSYEDYVQKFLYSKNLLNTILFVFYYFLEYGILLTVKKIYFALRLKIFKRFKHV